MNRRQFLRGIFAAVPAVALAPAAAEWLADMLAPRATIFLPPAGGWTQYAELGEIVRRAFVPSLVVQIYNSSPLMKALLANSRPPLGSEFALVESPSVLAAVGVRDAYQEGKVALLPPAQVLAVQGRPHYSAGPPLRQPRGTVAPPRLARDPNRPANYGTIEAALTDEPPAYLVPSAPV